MGTKHKVRNNSSDLSQSEYLNPLYLEAQKLKNHKYGLYKYFLKPAFKHFHWIFNLCSVDRYNHILIYSCYCV